MPATAQALAQRLGLAYRPDLMSGTGPDARQYQDAITNAAQQEAWKAGNGDPHAAAAYYFAGPNMKLHGAKTAAYADSVVARMGG